MKQEITRFAPSPTGHLHLGGARTAFFAWLHAKASNGKFLIRFEDTDKERSKDEYVKSILSSLSWLGIEPDEPPIFQSKKEAVHQKVALQLLNSGQAYSCDCTPEQLKNMREEQIKNKIQPKYDGFNRNNNLPHKQGNVIRFKMPQTGTTTFEDKILGSISVQNRELDDFIILRSDDSPTYNFCAALDDIDMNISTVIRGDDHITNTIKQINILTALNEAIPNYAHLPMVLSSDGKRLSKRDSAVDINDYKTRGYLKEALVNYLIKLGWTYKEQEIFSLRELIDFFSISDVNSSAAKFSQELLDFYNNHYLNSCSIDFLLELLNKDFNLSAKFNDLPRKKEIIELMREGAETLCELKENIDFFYQDPNLTPQLFDGIELEKEIFIKFNKDLVNLDFTEKNKIDTFLKSFLKLNNLKFPQLGKPLRLILTGKSDAPSISDLLYLIGRDACLERIQKFIDIY